MKFCGPAEDPVASVVICAYLSRHRIDRALGALRNQDVDEPFEVIAVVSGDDGCESHLASAHPDVRIVSSRLRIFPGRARNLGISAARAPVIAFVPDDGVADSGWLRARLCHHRRGVPLVAGGISNGTPMSIVGTAGYYVEYTASMPVLAVLERQPVPHTLSYAHDVFDTAGMFPEIDVPGEDTLLNQRCVDLGISHVFEPAAAMGHLNPTRLRPYLSHQASHGRGLARCVMTGTIADPFERRRGRRRLAISALVAYPLRRWVRTLSLARCGGRGHAIRFVLLTPLILAGYLAGGWGSWREFRRCEDELTPTRPVG